MSHDELAESLAAHLAGQGKRVWTDMQMGPAGSPRPDVWTLDKSFVSPVPTAYEVKVTRSDFRADVTAGKSHAYLWFSEAVIFACERGLLKKEEIPAKCGLIVHAETGWRMARRATREPVVIPQEVFLKLLIDGLAREGPCQRQKHWDIFMAQRKVQQRYGERAGRILADLDYALRETEHAKRTAEKILEDARRTAAASIEQVAPMLDDLRVALGADKGTDVWKLSAMIRNVKEAQRDHPILAAHRELKSAVRRVAELYCAADPQEEVVPGWATGRDGL